jgi:stringent starvation protein B
VKRRRPYLLRALYEWIVDSGEVPNVLVDAEIDGVVVPSEHVRDGQIVLNISPQAVRNLSLGNDYVMCEGRFSGRSVELILPIESVRAIYCRDSGQGLAFDDEDLLEGEGEGDGELGADVTQASQSTNGPKPPGDKPKLRLV